MMTTYEYQMKKIAQVRKKLFFAKKFKEMIDCDKIAL